MTFPFHDVRRTSILALCSLLAFGGAVDAQELRAPRTVTVDSVFHGLNARAIGPAGTSGRVAALAVSPIDDRVIYVGAATGGLWKSDDGGFAWTPIMDDASVNSIGALAVSPAAPHILWVGTGEANARNSMGVGRGVWKSIDGGGSWNHVGLERTEHIEAILPHPTDPDVAWLSAMGPAWSDGDQRGVFRTTDGGVTWENVLYVDETTGAFELVMDPSNPEHLLASTWEFRRRPWTMNSGGEGSGIWKTYDGGDSWTRLTSDDGLPAGNLGRIGLAFATNDPSVAYALVEAGTSALLRSDDGGDSWTSVNSEPGVNERAFYYSRVYVDPTNENRVYRVSGDLARSDDGGRTFNSIASFQKVHVDHHGFWAHPDGRTIISGNDGGVFVSRDRGGSWRFVENLPLSQFYHLSVDNEVPFNVYGGLQDNGSWRGPSQAWEMPSFSGSLIQNWHWKSIGFGDGFASLVDPTDASLGYSMSQGGNLQRFDLETGAWNNIRPTPPDADTELRFNWNAGIALDPFNPEVIYYGSQFLHMSPDRGESWQVISADLTTNDPEKQRQAESGGLTIDVSGAENHTTILTIAPSPVEQGVIWVGTDDGNVQLTRSGGGDWENVTERIDDVPDNTWVPHIEASKHHGGTAYVVFDGHREGDWTPYIFKTEDYGRDWEELNPDQIDGYVHVIEEDPVEPNLLFLGTEFGMYFSLDGGENWTKYTHGDYPAGAPTRALVVHPRDHDLAIGTHGRGAWIVDDIRPLREMASTPELSSSNLHLFEIPPAIQHTRGLSGPHMFPGDTDFQGENRPYGALISYFVSDSVAASVEDEGGGGGGPAAGGFAALFGGGGSQGSGPAKIEILDADSVIRTLKGPAKAGMNRTAWGLERRGVVPADADEDDDEPAGPEVLPGTYRVRVTLGDYSAEGEVAVSSDPRRSQAVQVVQANLDVFWEGQGKVEELRAQIRQLEDTKGVVSFYGERIKEWDEADDEVRDSLSARTDSLTTRIDGLLERLRMPPGLTGIRSDTTVTSRLGSALGEATGSPYAPSPGRRAQLRWATEVADGILGEILLFYTDEIPAYREELRSAGFDPLGVGS
ncbi:MAG: WD40/YVTN/BNR-like repeat-containing protein [Longimicrobiales bacterium]